MTDFEHSNDRDSTAETSLWQHAEHGARQEMAETLTEMIQAMYPELTLTEAALWAEDLTLMVQFGIRNKHLKPPKNTGMRIRYGTI